MAISTYSELITELERWLDRADDLALSNALPNIITLAEAWLNKVLRVRDMENREHQAISTEYMTLPSAAVALRASWVTQNGVKYPLRVMTLEQMAFEDKGETGRPVGMALLGENNEIRLFPAPDTSYDTDIVYYERLTGLTATQATNWLITDHPDIYLFACLRLASLFSRDQEGVSFWEGEANRAILALRESDEEDKQSGGSLVATVAIS